MEKQVAISYEDWLKNEIRAREWGIQAVVADSLMEKSRDAFDAMQRIMSQALTRSFVENGNHPLGVRTYSSFTIRLNATEFTSVLDCIQGKHPIQYLNLAYYAWQSEQCRRITWENKSLWQYVKAWYGRKFRND